MRGIFLLLIIPMLFACPFPPIDDVESYNLQIAEGLADYVPEGVGNPNSENPVTYSEGKLLGVFPSVDDRISVEEENTLIWTWGTKFLRSGYSDPDEDGCRDYFILMNYTIEPKITFEYNGERRVSYSKESRISIPFSQSELNTENAEKMLITLDWHTKFNYTVDDYIPYCSGNSSCYCKFGKTTVKVYETSMVNNISYYVEGGNPLFFMNKPLLKEQWYNNNHFDNVILSRRRIHSAEVMLNGEKFGDVCFYDYYIGVNEMNFSLLRVYSNYSYYNSNLSAHMSLANTTPNVLMEVNESFIYAYQFNSTYDGIGWNNLSLKVYDQFYQEFESGSEILSRMIGYGDVGSNEDYRGNTLFKLDELNPYVTSGSILVFLIIIIFFGMKKY